MRARDRLISFAMVLGARTDACVKEACTPEELKIAQAMLWDHLEGNDCPGMRQQRPVGWKQGAPETWVEGHGDGAMTSTTHCDAMWYIRTRPGVVGGFRAAYQEHGVVAAYGAPSPSACRRLAPQANGHELTRMRTDRMMINLPTSTQNEATLAMAERNYRHGKLNAQGLHTHYNQVCTCSLLRSAELTGSAPAAGWVRRRRAHLLRHPPDLRHEPGDGCDRHRP